MRADLAAPRCPKRGWVMLSTEDTDYVVPTVCKTWRCQSCGQKVRQLTAMKMMYGCLSTGRPSHFITTTYRKRPGDRIRNAGNVAEEWAALWRLLKKRAAWENAAWVKVPELTRRGQVHLHGIVVNAEGRDTCRTSTKARWAWMQRNCSEDCLEHDLARAWYEVTGDSFVVDCEVVRSPGGAASYVQKYMSKSFEGTRRAMEELCFKRRWSASRNWPRVAPLRLLGTELGAWEDVTRFNGSKANYAQHSEDEPVRMSDMYEDQELAKPALLEHVGDEYLLALRALARNRKDIKDAMKGLGVAV